MSIVFSFFRIFRAHMIVDKTRRRHVSRWCVLLSADVTAEEFISWSSSDDSSTAGSSQYSRFREQVALRLNVPVDNVDVMTVRNHPTLRRTVDVRYCAHGSPFYRQTRLDGLLSLHIPQVIFIDVDRARML